MQRKGVFGVPTANPPRRPRKRTGGVFSSPLRSGAAMSDRLAAVNAALDAALVSDRWLEEAAIEHCQQGLVDFYVDEIAALLAIQASLRRLG